MPCLATALVPVKLFMGSMCNEVRQSGFSDYTTATRRVSFICITLKGFSNINFYRSSALNPLPCVIWTDHRKLLGGLHSYSGVDTYYYQTLHSHPPNSLAGVRGPHSGICNFKRHPDTAKDEELFGCLMSGYSVPLADTTPHLICQGKHVPLFSLPNSLVTAQKRLLSKIGTVACSTQAHLPMTCCPQAAKTTGRTPVVPSLQPWVSRSLSSAGLCCGTIESDSHTSVTLQSALNNCAVSRYVFKLGCPMLPQETWFIRIDNRRTAPRLELAGLLHNRFQIDFHPHISHAGLRWARDIIGSVGFRGTAKDPQKSGDNEIHFQIRWCKPSHECFHKPKQEILLAGKSSKKKGFCRYI